MANGSTTIESRAASAGAFVATLAGQFVLRSPRAARDHNQQRRERGGERHEPRGLFRRRLRLRRWLRLSRDAYLQRIDPNRPFDVLELRRTQIGDFSFEFAAYLTIGVLGETDRAGGRDAFQPRGDIDAIPIRSPSPSSTTSPT